MSMFITADINCTGLTARFIVNNTNPEFYFPLDYILAWDIDLDGQYTFADVYTTGEDYTAPDMAISGLPMGQYRINIGPVQGCSYKTFDFTIGPCTVLPFTLESFTAVRGQNTIFDAQLSGGDELTDIILQGSINGRDFFNITSLPFNKTATIQDLHYEMANNEFVYFRLLMGTPDHHAKYSEVRKVSSLHSVNSYQLAGNPVSDEIKIMATVTKKETLDIQVINGAGQVLSKRQQVIYNGENLVKIPAQALSKGIYFVKISSVNAAPQTFRVLKQ